jgi:trimeric autotransporter adhesin
LSVDVTLPEAGVALQSLLWDLDGDGRFGEASGSTLALSWEQLVDFGLNDDGIYQIGVEAIDDLGRSARAFTTLIIDNTPPTVTLGGNASTEVGQAYQLSFTATDPGDDHIREWRVNWGDGSPMEVFGSGATAAQHVFPTPGNFEIQVQPVDEDSAPDAYPPTQKSVIVAIAAAQVSAGGPYRIAEGAPLQLGAAAAGSVESYSWDINGDGIFGDAGGDSPWLSWDDLQNLPQNPIRNDGTFEVRVQATYSGPQGTVVVTSDPTMLTVDNTPPVATLVNNGPIDQGSTIFNHATQTREAAPLVVTVEFDPLTVDPSQDDRDAGFTFSFDFDNNGLFDGVDIIDSSSPSAVVPASLLGKSGTQTVRAVIKDDRGATEMFTEIVIREVAPILNLSGVATVVEGAPYSLELSATDPGDDEIERWIVDWGDGQVDSFDGPLQSLTHAFADNGLRTVTVTAIDEAGIYAETLEVLVTNAPPQLLDVALSATEIIEGDTVRLTGTIQDDGSEDSFRLFIDWGNGIRETFDFEAGATSFDVSHLYQDNPDGTDGDDYTISLTLTDKDGDSADATTSITVRNAAPSISDLGFATATVAQDGLVSLAGSYDDLGELDTHSVLIQWGDGTTSEADVDAEARTFSASHRYSQNIRGAATRTILATVTDNDQDFGTATIDVTIVGINEEPTGVIIDGALVQERAATGALIGSLTALDPDVDDTHTFDLLDDADGRFKLVGNQVLVADGALLDYSASTSHTILVRATDEGGLWVDELLTIVVENRLDLLDFDVQRGATQRSFIRYLDLVFDDEDSLNQLIAEQRIQLLFRGLDGTGAVDVSLANRIASSGGQLTIDFGALGIGDFEGLGTGASNRSNSGDGFYTLLLDLDGDGSYETTRSFYRLFGDVNGDRQVTDADVDQIFANYGVGENLDEDTDGDGRVNSIDRLLTFRARGRSLSDSIFIDD